MLVSGALTRCLLSLRYRVAAMYMKLLLVLATLFFTTREVVLAVVPVISGVGLVCSSLLWPPFMAATGPPLVAVEASGRRARMFACCRRRCCRSCPAGPLLPAALSWDLDAIFCGKNVVRSDTANKLRVLVDVGVLWTYFTGLAFVLYVACCDGTKVAARACLTCCVCVCVCVCVACQVVHDGSMG